MPEIKWSQKAQKELNNTLIDWCERNKSEAFSMKILKEVNIKQDFLERNPNSGIPVNYKSVFKIQVLKFFSLVYEVKKDEIRILSFWDNRRNPENLEI